MYIYIYDIIYDIIYIYTHMYRGPAYACNNVWSVLYTQSKNNIGNLMGPNKWDC